MCISQFLVIAVSTILLRQRVCPHNRATHSLTLHEMLARRLSISLALRPVSPFLPRSVFQHLTFPAAEDITRSHAFLPPSRPFHRFIHTKTPATSNIAPRNRFIHTKNPASSNVPPSAATKTATEAATKPAPYTFSGLKTRFNRIWNKYGAYKSEASMPCGRETRKRCEHVSLTRST